MNYCRNIMSAITLAALASAVCAQPLKQEGMKRWSLKKQPFRNCMLVCKPGELKKSPWLTEIRQKMDGAWGGEKNLRDNRGLEIGCVFHLEKDGSAKDLRALHPNSHAEKEQEAAFRIIKNIMPVTPLEGPLSANNRIQITIIFKDFPHYQLFQVLEPNSLSYLNRRYRSSHKVIAKR